MVKRAVNLRGSPTVPPQGTVDDGRIGLPIQFGAVAAFGLRVMQVLEDLDPGDLFDVVQFVRDAVFVAKFAFDAAEGAFVCSIQPGVLASVSHLGARGAGGLVLASGTKNGPDGCPPS
jgi:hypothetical protein